MLGRVRNVQRVFIENIHVHGATKIWGNNTFRSTAAPGLACFVSRAAFDVVLSMFMLNYVCCACSAMTRHSKCVFYIFVQAAVRFVRLPKLKLGILKCACGHVYTCAQCDSVCRYYFQRPKFQKGCGALIKGTSVFCSKNTLIFGTQLNRFGGFDESVRQNVCHQRTCVFYWQTNKIQFTTEYNYVFTFLANYVFRLHIQIVSFI